MTEPSPTDAAPAGSTASAATAGSADSEPDASTPATQAKAHLVGVFDRSSDTYDQVGVDFFTTFGPRLVTHAGIGPGDRVLDVGCGRGAVLFPAASAVGPSGSVLGIDLAPGMVERTASEVAARTLTQVEVRLGDAEAPQVAPATFDAVLVGFVIFFLPDHAAALDAYRDALVPGGTLAMSTFGPEDDRFAPVFAAVAAHIPTPEGTPASSKTPARAQEGPFGRSDTITALLEDHGYDSITHEEQTYDVEFDDGEQWIAWSWSHGARALWESVPQDRRQAAHDDAVSALAELTPVEGPLTHRWVVRYTVAHRPDDPIAG